MPLNLPPLPVPAPINGIDPSVAIHTPNLYAAAASMNLQAPQKNQLNQISATIGLNKQLASMSTSDAQTQFHSLDPNVQTQLKAMYGDAPYMQQQQKNIAYRAIGAVAGAVLGPFKWAYKNVVNDYNRILPVNAPYLYAREIAQGANPFALSTWRNAWDGKSVYDMGALANLRKQYSDTDTFVAMKLLEGQKPGQIVDSYGSVNSGIIASITKMFNDPKNFQTMLDQFKGAQVSVGRDAARMLFNHQPDDNKVYSSTGWHLVSGAIDAVAQIVSDPLTWLTGGTSKAVTRADRLGELLAKDPSTANVEKVFTDKSRFGGMTPKDTWDKVAGPMIERLDNATKAGDIASIVKAKNEIATVMPSLRNDAMIELLRKEKVFNGDQAIKLFSNAEPMLELMAGRVDGATFFRTGIPIATRSRVINSRVNSIVSKALNGTATEEEMTTGFGKLMDDVRHSNIASSPDTVVQSEALAAETAKLNSISKKLGRYAARFPGNAGINVMDGNVDQSLNAVRNLARTIYSKSFADYFAEGFKASNPADRVLLLRGLYVQVMHNMGLHGTEDGINLMNNILNDKFANVAGFANKKDMYVPDQHFLDIRTKGPAFEKTTKEENGLLKYNHEGVIHNYQGKPTIGNLPWGQLTDYAFNISGTKWKYDVINATQGHTARKFMRGITNQWSTATLFPRLGIRSAIDEAFFYSMMAPGDDLMRLGLGRKLNKGSMILRGSDAQIPPIKRMILNRLGKNPANALQDWQRVKEVAAPNGETVKMWEDKAKVAENANNFMEAVIPKGRAVVDEAGKKSYPTQERRIDYMNQAYVHTDGVINNAIVNSAIGKSTLEEGKGGGDLAAEIFNKSHLTQAMKEEGFYPTGKYEIKDVESMAPAMVAMAHYKNFFMRFNRNAANYGKKFDTFFNPAEIFIKHGALIEHGSFGKAVDEALSKLGVQAVGDDLKVTNAKVLDNFLSMSQQSVKDVEKGLTPAQSALNRVEAIFLDMYDTFHGAANKENRNLLSHITNQASSIQDASIQEGVPTMTRGKAIREALNTLDFKTFKNLTDGFRPEVTINTDLNTAKDLTNEGYIQKMLHWMQHAPEQAMEWMDAQNNHLFRQPALWLTYIKYRERYAPLEEKFYNELIDSKMEPVMAREIAEKKFTETALSHASNFVLKSVDNPAIRSNLAWTLRTAGRFYRANEDFYRRVWRLKDVTPQVLFRLRMASLGLQSNGFIHPDSNGDPYLVMPADNLIFHAIQGPMGMFGANVKQPMFDEFAVKLSMGNPSFQQDAGQPTLSGPFMAVPIMGIKSILKGWGGSLGAQASTSIDKAVLGNVNQNLTFAKAIVPSSIQRIWQMLGANDQDQQEVSAGMQAIAYNAAHGLFLTPEKVNALPADERQTAINNYLNSIRITAHNVNFLRGFLGLMSPIGPTAQESKDVPSYLKNAGINGLRPEFSDLLQSVMRNSKGMIQDPYGAALMAYTGKYPGKLVYTVARDQRSTQLALSYTKEMQSYVAQHQGLINDYGDAALIFAPKIGQYDSNIFAWMQASGMIKSRTLQDYFDEVAVAQDRQTYYNWREQANAAAADPSVDAQTKLNIANDAAAQMQALKNSNPWLEQSLNNKSYGVGKQELMLTNLQDMLANNKVPANDAVKQKIKWAVDLTNTALAQIKEINSQSSVSYVANAAQLKQDFKNKALNAIREIGGAQGSNAPVDPIIAEALKSIFLPVLDYYARNPNGVVTK